jgi:integrase/recombinase XerD
MTWIITKEKYLTEQEIQKLRVSLEKEMAYAKTKGLQQAVRDYTLIELALGTGLRASEISNLKVNDIALGKSQNSLIVRKGKGGESRQIVFSSRLEKIIQDYLDYRNSNSVYLFTSKRRNKLSRIAMYKMVKKCFIFAGLPDHFSIHSLRHTYATQLYIKSGYNLRLVQQQLGHSSINTTSVYKAVINPDLEMAVEILEKE